MTTKENLKGALFFSDGHPQISGYLVICGIEYEIAGWRASEIRSEITARERGPIQTDIFGEARTGGTNGERGSDNQRSDRAGGEEGRPDPTE
jgi:hypothetical protein